MKVLSANKFFYPKGGSEIHFFNLNQMLEERGVQIIPFSMKDGKNTASPYEAYFIDPVDYSRGGWSKIKNSLKVIYSVEAKRKLRKILRETKPDLAHLHVFQHQMSPSILKVLKKHNVPIVHTAHDLKILCPNYKMRNHGRICEKCKGHRYYHCFVGSCVKDSRLGSLVNTLEMYLHRLLHSYSLVDAFILPSRFFRDKFIEYGYPEEKLVYIPNFVDAASYVPNYDSADYFLYFGRLSEEKGLMTLLEAVKIMSLPDFGSRPNSGKLESDGPDFGSKPDFSRLNSGGPDLYLVGEGTLREKIAAFIEENGLNRVKCLGYKSGKELQELIRNSMFTVIPSEVYENSPLSVLEAMACGKPVIGSDIGGIPELVQNGTTGLVFPSGNAEELADRIRKLADHPEWRREMGENARAQVETKYGKETYYLKISEVYNRLLAGGREAYGRVDSCNV